MCHGLTIESTHRILIPPPFRNHVIFFRLAAKLQILKLISITNFYLLLDSQIAWAIAFFFEAQSSRKLGGYNHFFDQHKIA